METVKDYLMQRKDIAIRLLYTIFFIIVLELLKLVVQLIVIFQFVYLLITCSSNEPIRKFGNKAVTYVYRIMRYVTLNENTKPFPFAPFPEEIEPSEQPEKEST
jgi:hypothetical protein